jgi:hypothetical protein
LIFTVQIPAFPEKESVFTPRYSRPAAAVITMELPTSNGGPLPNLAMRDQQGSCGAGNRERRAA